MWLTHAVTIHFIFDEVTFHILLLKSLLGRFFSSHNWAGGKYWFFCIPDVGQTWIMFLSLSQILWLCLTIFHPCIPARKHFGDCLLIVWKSQNWLNCAYIKDLETSFGDQLMQLQFPAYLMKATFIIILVKSLHGRQL